MPVSGMWRPVSVSACVHVIHLQGLTCLCIPHYHYNMPFQEVYTHTLSWERVPKTLQWLILGVCVCVQGSKINWGQSWEFSFSSTACSPLPWRLLVTIETRDMCTWYKWNVCALDCLVLTLLQLLWIHVCVCVCSCAYHLLCHLSNWTDCLASQHQMVPAVVRHCRIQPYISYNNAYTHTHTCIHTSRLISETDQRFTSFHTKKTSGRCRFTLTSTFFHTCVLICEESVRSHTVRVKRSEL